MPFRRATAALLTALVLWSIGSDTRLRGAEQPDTAPNLVKLQPIPARSAIRGISDGVAGPVRSWEFMAMTAPAPRADMRPMEESAGSARRAEPRGEVAGLEGRPPRRDGAERWLRHPFAFHADKYPIETLLGRFAAKQGVGAKVSPRIAGVISGDISFRNPREFLDVVARTQLVNWYFDGVSAHFYPSDEMHTRLMPLENVDAQTVRESLETLGLFDERFEWLVTDDRRLLKVQGPDVYLDKITSIIEQEKAAAREKRGYALALRKEKRLQVIRLDYAWADDKTVATSDSSVTVPGVAELLRQILREQPRAGRPAVPPTPLGTSSLNRGAGLVARRRAALQEAAAPAPAPPDEYGSGNEPADIPVVQADARLNAVLIWDTEENHARNEQIVRELDQPLAMVEIRAAIVEVEADRTRDLGINFEASDGSGNWTNHGGSNSESGDSYLSVKGDGLNFTTIYAHGLDNLMVRVKAMEKEGAAEVLSRPSVLTLDNIQATLEQTETYYVKLEGYEEVDLADISTGMTMRVTPHIINHGEGGIQMAVYLTTGADTTSGSGNDYVPRVRQSTISTQAVVKEGEALVIGGYYNETRTKSESGIPLLRRIPGVGALFRNRNKLFTKVEKLFVLSPRIIYPGNSPMGAGTRAEYVIEHSPERDALDLPSEPCETDGDKKERKKRRRLSLNMD